MNNIRKFLALTLAMVPNNNYITGAYYTDPEVTDCLLKMYFFMLAEDDNPNKDRYFNEFDELYDKLSPEQQEIVKQDYLSIIEEQDRHLNEDESFTI